MAAELCDRRQPPGLGLDELRFDLPVPQSWLAVTDQPGIRSRELKERTAGQTCVLGRQLCTGCRVAMFAPLIPPGMQWILRWGNGAEGFHMGGCTCRVERQGGGGGGGLWFVVCGALTVRIILSDSARLVTGAPPHPCQLVRGDP